MSASTFAPAPQPPLDAAAPVLATAKDTVADWIRLVSAEHLEMPGLHLTKAQMQRLWNLDEVRCDALVGALTDVKFLRRTASGSFVRTDGGGW
jgi:hypothetical protein